MDGPVGARTSGPATAASRVLRRLARRAAILGALAALSLLAGCGQAMVSGKVGVEPRNMGEGTVVIRVFGTEGVRYFGSYGLLEDKLERTTETLVAGPTSYEVPVEERGPDYDVVSATFMKLAPEGYLRVAILWRGEVVAQETTRADEGLITLNYAPPADPGGTLEEGSGP